ncbi:MAG: triose-phosphate isomerase [Candidatus Ancaeobacter aquaticus]|nr:triose-phosphate isomerase [Candidatus Ancaeobacter aquaticus]
MRKPIIAGNWKLHKNITEAKELVEKLKNDLTGIDDVDIVVCPCFTALWEVAKTLSGSNIASGAQNMFWEPKGAFTGEISASQIKDTGATYVIIGHSERRQYFGETNETVNKKIKAALAEGLTPIVCVGEVLAEREEGRMQEVLKVQVTESLAGLTKEEMVKCVIAYEPVWAIGTGKTATPDQAQDVHQYIRSLIGDMFDKSVSDSIRIQYGGSVKPSNVSELMAKDSIDGALVGGASLEADSFVQLVKYEK